MKIEHSILKKLTIVIYSYNRHKYLKQTIKYWLDYNINLVVLDGSDERLNDPCLDMKNIKYVHNPKGLYERLLSSIDYIDTEYMILACDDEFYLPSTLSSCIEFLINNPSFSSCGGRALGFGHDGKNYFGFDPYPKLKNLCLDSNNNINRLIKHFSTYVPAHVYSVMNISKWKKICTHTFKKKYNFFAAFEVQIEFLSIVSGKSKIIPHLLWMRNREVEPLAVKYPNLDQSLRINKWWYDKKYLSEKKDFLITMKKACDEISINQNLQLTENKIAMLFEILISTRAFKKNPLKKTINFFHIKIKKLIKLIFRRDRVRYKSITDQAKVLESQNVIVNYKELSKIILILQHSKNKD